MQKNTRETDLLKKEPWLVPRYGLADLKEFLRCNRIQHILKPLSNAMVNQLRKLIQNHTAVFISLFIP